MYVYTHIYVPILSLRCRSTLNSSSKFCVCCYSCCCYNIEQQQCFLGKLVLFALFSTLLTLDFVFVILARVVIPQHCCCCCFFIVLWITVYNAALVVNIFYICCSCCKQLQSMFSLLIYFSPLILFFLCCLLLLLRVVNTQHIYICIFSVIHVCCCRHYAI